jgi:hypothetical protein
MNRDCRYDIVLLIRKAHSECRVEVGRLNTQVPQLNEDIHEHRCVTRVGGHTIELPTIHHAGEALTRIATNDVEVRLVPYLCNPSSYREPNE